MAFSVTPDVTRCQVPFVTRGTVVFSRGVTDTYGMDKPGHFIRQWRQSKPRLSLRALADRLTNPDGSTIISYASLSRIERGEQEYTQPILEGIADAIGTDPGSLIMRDPSQEKPLWSIWDQIPAAERPRALEVLAAFTKRDATGR